MADIEHNFGLRSLVDSEGFLHLHLVPEQIREPKDDEVVMRVEAAPLNPTDLFTLIGPADTATGETLGAGFDTSYRAQLKKQPSLIVPLRMKKDLKSGTEGAGTIVKAGSSSRAQALLGKTVAAMDGALYCRYRTLKAAQCMVLPEGISAREGAASFINPLTALGFIETLKRDGYRSMIHTAAASNLGQMLVRLCGNEDIELVNIVRSTEQAQLLKSLGADHVLNSRDTDFVDRLVEVIKKTGAYTVYDAIGGGELLGTVMSSMEAAALSDDKRQNPYGSDVRKTAYVYGNLDPGPTILSRNFGFNWSINSWLLLTFLSSIDEKARNALQKKVVDGLRTVFASHYSGDLSLTDVMQADVVSSFTRLATGEKYLINPTLPI